MDKKVEAEQKTAVNKYHQCIWALTKHEQVNNTSNLVDPGW